MGDHRFPWRQNNRHNRHKPHEITLIFRTKLKIVHVSPIPVVCSSNFRLQPETCPCLGWDFGRVGPIGLAFLVVGGRWVLPQFQISNAIARSRWTRVGLKAAATLATLSLVVGSAILAKEWRSAPPLARVVEIPGAASAAVGLPAFDIQEPASLDDSIDDTDTVAASARSLIDEPVTSELPGGAIARASDIDPHTLDPRTRWFNGRPIKPARQMWMIVTGYSPDSRSCGDSADGITATLHSVETNAHKLVAADPRVLRYGSMLTIPGYDSDLVVPVLDCGSAIKGNRLDLLFPTHEQARQWGKKKLLVTIWAYADGKPADNPRKMR